MLPITQTAENCLPYSLYRVLQNTLVSKEKFARK